MTTVAPLPGRETGSGGEDDDRAEDRDVVGQVTAPAGPAATGRDTVVDLTSHRPRAVVNDPAGQASWVLGLALSLLSEGTAERVAMAEILAEAAGRSRAIEGAYGRAVALLSEYPGDPLVHRTVDLLAKALLRSRRPARAD